MKSEAIEIRGLEKRFGAFKLGPLDLSVPRGAIYGLIGPNGAGKTTTIDMMLGLGRQDAGEIRIFGLGHRDAEVEVKRRLGYVSPDLSYAAWVKVKRVIHFQRQFYPEWDDDYCGRLLDTLGVGWDERINALSFGARVKLGLIVALSHRPELLILDEPTIGIDAVSKRQIFTELLAAVQDENRTVLIASHGLADIERFADHIGMIRDGQMLLEGPTSEIVERYQMVDLAWGNGSAPAIEGVFVQERRDDGMRALVDMKGEALNCLKATGARDISVSPVTLEEIFVALAQED